MPDITVAVVGGSIGGLTTANVLRDLGCRVDVYERSNRTLVGFGNGIVAQPELTRYFVERMGVDLDEMTVPSSTMQYYNASTVEALGAVEADWRFTSFDALYRGLLGAFNEDSYHLNHLLDRFEHDPANPETGVTLHFANGEQTHCDLAVFADGGGSTARKQLLGTTAEYAGYISWRSLAQRDNLTASCWDFFDEAFTYGLLPDSHIIAYPIPLLNEETETRSRQLNLQWYWNIDQGPDLDEIMTDQDGQRRPVSVHPAVMQERWIQNLHKRAQAELSGPFAELINSGTKPFVTTISDATVSKLVHGRSVLLGDAGFTPRPHAAAGAAQAAANAWDLGVALQNNPTDIGAALAAWEPAQLIRGNALIDKVRHMASLLQTGGRFEPNDPACRFGLAS